MILKPAAYLAVNELWGDKRAKHSQLPYMKHIDEGVAILERMRAHVTVIEAFCLHPFFQTLPIPWSHPIYLQFRQQFSDRGIRLALEYTITANAYLPVHVEGSFDQVHLSPYPEVNMMLIADKVQNRFDFERNSAYFKAKPDRVGRLDVYFDNWFRALSLTKGRVIELELSCKAAAPPRGTNGVAHAV